MKVAGFTICKYIHFEKLVEISLNLMGFTDFLYKEILISLISFSSRDAFSLNMLLKASVV